MAKNIKDPLTRLEEIGVSEISKNTHVEGEYIEAIISKNFEKLQNKNIKAYIKIIEREYDLDLQGWLDEYRANYDEYENSKSCSFESISSQEITIKDHKRLPKFFFWVVLLAIVVWAILNFKLYDLSWLNSEENLTSFSTNTTMVEVAGSKLENIGIEVVNLDEPLNAKPIQMNALEKSIMFEGAENNIDENSTTLSKDENTTVEQENVVLEDLELITTGASIVPSENLWIGIIEVKSGNKSTVTTAKEYQINLDKEQLILTGHGLFGLKINGDTQTFNDQNPHRLHIKDGKVNQISYDEFLKLNSGKAW
ncbi:MAG: hypothetical protein GXZ15_02140 [Campylobacter sp.]|nr:hypothetical protein [Campylobacter sp.]